MRYCCHHVFLLWGCGSDGQRPVRGHGFAGYSNQQLNRDASHFITQIPGTLRFFTLEPLYDVVAGSNVEHVAGCRV